MLVGLCWKRGTRSALDLGSRSPWWLVWTKTTSRRSALLTNEAKLVLEVHVRLRLHRLLVDGRGHLLLAPFGAEKPSFFIFFRGLRGFGHDLGTALRCLRILLATRRAEDWAFGWREA